MGSCASNTGLTTLNSKMVKTTVVTGSTDAAGNVGLGATSTRLIIGVCPDRTVNADVLSAFLTTTANGSNYMAKCVNANLQAVTSVNVGIKIAYIDL